MFKLKERARKAYHDFLRIHDAPREVALGLALGIIIGISPIFGVQIISAILIASLLRWNTVAAGLGTLITNPLTTPFIYGLTYYVGSRVINVRLDLPKISEWTFKDVLQMMEKTPEILWALLIGGLIIGLPVAIAGYFAAYSAVEQYQTKLKAKLARQKEKLALRRARLAERSKLLKDKFKAKKARRKKQKSHKKLLRLRTRKRS